MYALDTFEKLGVWWPHNAENFVAGRIKYDKGSITLQIMMPLDPADHMDTLAKILPHANQENTNESLPKLEYVKGILESGEHVLLNNCMFVKSNITNGVYNKFYRVSRMFAGEADPRTDMKSDRIAIRYTSLYTWLWPETIHVKTNPENILEMSFTHMPPKDMRINLSKSNFLEINYGHTRYFPAVIKNFTITQSASVVFESKTPLDLETLYDKILPFRNFLMLATDTRIQLESTHLRADNDFFAVFQDIKLYEDIDKEQDIDKMNFNYRQIEKNFKNIIRYWFRYHAKYEKALNLYFETKLEEPHLPINITFLRIVQSLEALHRIKNSSRNGLKEKLEDLAKGSHDIFNSHINPNAFFQDVIIARDYFSHGYIKDNQNKMPSDKELIKITRILDLLMFVCIIEDSRLSKKLKREIRQNKIKKTHQIRFY